jgi:hypothetical protein
MIYTYDLHFSSNVIRAMNSRRMNWAGYVARTENGGEVRIESICG